MTRLRQPSLVFMLALCAPLSVIGASEVLTMAGTSHQGEVVSISHQEVQLKGADGKVQTWKAADVLAVTLSTSSPTPPKDSYYRVQLRDGTLLIAKSFASKGSIAEIKLFTDETLQVPWHSLHHVLFQANNPELAAEFDSWVAQKPKLDILRLQSRDGKSVNTFKGSLGETDATGQNLRFQAEGANATTIQWERIRGLYFSRPAVDTPVPVCKVIDNSGNVFVVTTLSLERRTVPNKIVMESLRPRLVSTDESWVKLQTPAGLETKVTLATILRFDFSLGKVAFLSDLEPLRVERASVLLENHPGYRRDMNLEGRSISLGGKSYAKGLAMPSRTVLDYDVTGYNLFRTLIGIDDGMSGPAHAIVRIEGDGRELFSTPVTRRDIKPKEIELRITGIKKLRIIVDYGEDWDLGDHVDLANARIVK